MTELGTLTLARLYAAQGAFERALRIYDGLLVETPEDATVRDERESVVKRMRGEDEDQRSESALDSDIRQLETWLTRLRESREKKHGI